MVRIALLASLVAACRITSDYGATSFQCPDGTCPAGQTCVDGVCQVEVGTGDAAAADAPPVGAIDATPLVVDRRSCKTIRDSGGSVGDGVYSLDRGGDLPELEVYCDMTVAGGGFTLIGRSADGVSGALFGWGEDTGSLADDTSPYALAADQLEPFTQVLVGSRGDGKSWGPNVYKIDLPADFLATYPTSSTTVTPEKIRGDCEPSGGPTMLRHAGFVADTSKFYLRDNAENDQFGLRPDGWNTNYDDCDFGGLLNGTQGMIFVR